MTQAQSRADGMAVGGFVRHGAIALAPVCLVVAVFAVLLAALPSPPALAAANDLPEASAARLAGDQKRTRFVMDLDRSVAFRIFALPDPYRIIVDLPELNFTDETVSTEARGLVTAFRYGRFAPGKSRVVLDADGPVKIDKAFVLEPIEDQPARLVIDLVPTGRKQFMRDLALAPPRPLEPADQPQVPTIPVNPVPPGGAQGQKPLVVIDPGHGGVDPGAIGRDGTLEKEIVLEVAQRLAEELRALGKYRVKMTRDDDRFLRLGERVDFARANRASLFISLHADAIRYSSISGATVYTRSDRASDAAAQLLAERENRADLIAGVDLTEETDEVAGILFDLVRRETRNFSATFARGLIDEMRGKVKLIKNPLRSARFRVLSAPDVPSVLVELGYLTNRREEKTMRTQAWQQKMVGAITTAVDGYFGRNFAASTVQ